MMVAQRQTRNVFVIQGKSLRHCILDSIGKNISFETYARLTVCVKMHWNGMTRHQSATLTDDALALWREFQPMSLVDFPQPPLQSNNCYPTQKRREVTHGRDRRDAVASSASDYCDWKGGIRKIHQATSRL